MKFDLDPECSPKNISVLKSSPAGEYDSEALRAVAKWRYKPVVVDGKAVWVRDQKVKLTFKQGDPAR